MSNSTSDLVKNLNASIFWINRIIPLFQIAFGTFGNLFNMVIFTRPFLRTNPCSIYFLVSSVNNFFVIYVALLTRYLATSWNLDPSARSSVWCKLRVILVYVSVCLTLWLTVLASIDRFFSSSRNARLRRLSRLSIARKIIAFAIIFVFLIHTHMLIFYRSDVSEGEMTCNMFSNEYIIFFNFFFLIVSCILPIILMMIFGILMILNVRNTHHRVAQHGRNVRLRSNDRQLIKMLLFQVLITTIFAAPYAIIGVYNTIAVTILKYKFSTSEQAIYNILNNIFRLFYYTNPVVGFYIYTLTGTKFRTEITRCILCGLKSALTAVGLQRYLPLPAQQILLDQNRTNIHNASFILSRKRNTVHPLEQHKPMNMTAVL